MTVTNNWTAEKPLFGKVFGLLIICCMLIATSCSKGAPVVPEPAPEAPTTVTGGGVEQPVVVTDPTQPIVDPSTGEYYVCTSEFCGGSLQYYTGYLYKAAHQQPYESFLFINGNSYFISNHSSSAVQNILWGLYPGWYKITFSGYITYESNHRPNSYSTYEVFVIQNTY